MKKLFIVIAAILLSLTADAQTKYLVNQDFTKAEKKTNKIKTEYVFDNKLNYELNLKIIEAQGRIIQDTVLDNLKFDGFYKNKTGKIYFTKLDKTNNTVIQTKKPKTLTTLGFAWEIIYLLFLTIGSSLFYIFHIHKNKEGDSINLMAFKMALIIVEIITIFIVYYLKNRFPIDTSLLIILISFMSGCLSLINGLIEMDKFGYIVVSIIHTIIGSIIIYLYPNLWAWALNGFVFLFMWLLFKIPFAWDYLHSRTPGQIIRKAQKGW